MIYLFEDISWFKISGLVNKINKTGLFVSLNHDFHRFQIW